MSSELQETSERSEVVLGIDVGGTGARAAIEPLAGVFGSSRDVVSGPAVRITAGGSTAPAVTTALIAQARDELEANRPGARIAAVAIGATGIASLVTNPAASLAALSSAAGGAPVALAIDAVTAHLGALGGEAGAVVAVGTGTIALGTDLHEVWRRVGGWGHLYDDRGSGAWIGIEGLKAAIQHHDGLRADASALLSAAESRFGAAPTWPAQLYTRDDRGSVLAGFAADVAGLAALDDPAAVRIMTDAGTLVAQTLAAALDPALPRRAAGVGGVFAAGGAFTAAFTSEFARLTPDASLTVGAATPLDGAVRLARLLAAGRVPTGHPPFLWR